MHSIRYKDEFKMPEVKMMIWLIYDIFFTGIGSLSIITTFYEHIDEVQRGTIFLIFIVMAVIRIKSMIQRNYEKQEDIIRKRQENEAHRLEIQARRDEINGVKK